MDVVVIVGAGGMGLACARRIGTGQRLLLADNNTSGLKSAAECLRDAGYEVLTQAVDVADAPSVAKLAAGLHKQPAGCGPWCTQQACHHPWRRPSASMPWICSVPRW